MAQDEMWPSGEDLPLFSGTAPRVEPPKVKPSSKGRQSSLPFHCGGCMDTGIVRLKGRGAVKYCWCEEGRQRLAHDHPNDGHQLGRTTAVVTR